MSETQHEQDELADAWDVFQLWTGGRDADLFRRSYLGHYQSRDHFGRSCWPGSAPTAVCNGCRTGSRPTSASTARR